MADKAAAAQQARHVALLAAASCVEPLQPTTDPDDLAAHAELITDLAWLLEGYAKSGVRDIIVPGRLRERYAAARADE